MYCIAADTLALRDREVSGAPVRDREVGGDHKVAGDARWSRPVRRQAGETHRQLLRTM